MGTAVARSAVPHPEVEGASVSYGRGSQGSLGQGPPGQARAVATTHQEAAAAPDVIIGTILLFNKEVHALIDPVSTHSFIAPYLYQKPGVLGEDLIVRTP